MCTLLFALRLVSEHQVSEHLFSKVKIYCEASFPELFKYGTHSGNFEIVEKTGEI